MSNTDDPSLHSQASEEAIDWRADYPPEVVKEALDLAAMLALHVPPEFPLSELARRIAIPLDRVSRERTRQALRDVMFAVEATVGRDYSDRERNIVGRAVEAIRLLRVSADGESVASEEKEE